MKVVNIFFIICCNIQEVLGQILCTVICREYILYLRINFNILCDRNYLYNEIFKVYITIAAYLNNLFKSYKKF